MLSLKLGHGLGGGTLVTGEIVVIQGTLSSRCYCVLSMSCYSGWARGFGMSCGLEFMTAARGNGFSETGCTSVLPHGERLHCVPLALCMLSLLLLLLDFFLSFLLFC